MCTCVNMLCWLCSDGQPRMTHLLCDKSHSLSLGRMPAVTVRAVYVPTNV